MKTVIFRHPRGLFVVEEDANGIREARWTPEKDERGRACDVPIEPTIFYRKRGTTLDAWQKYQVKTLYQEGWTLTAIAQKIGKSRTCIRNYLEVIGLYTYYGE